MSKLERNTQRELTEAVVARYHSSTKREKALILDEFAAITGFHRKHAIRILNARPSDKLLTKRRRGTVYDEAVRQALIVLWEASDRICGKRLKPLIPVLLGALEQHGHLQVDTAVRSALLAHECRFDRSSPRSRAVSRQGIEAKGTLCQSRCTDTHLRRLA